MVLRFVLKVGCSTLQQGCIIVLKMSKQLRGAEHLVYNGIPELSFWPSLSLLPILNKRPLFPAINEELFQGDEVHSATLKGPF